MRQFILLLLSGICLCAGPSTKPFEFQNADEILALFPHHCMPASNDKWTEAQVTAFPDAPYDKVLDHTSRLAFTLTEVTVIKPLHPIRVAGRSLSGTQILIDGTMPESMRVKGMRVKLHAIFQFGDEQSESMIAMVSKCERNKQAIIEGMVAFSILEDKDGKFFRISVAPEKIEPGK